MIIEELDLTLFNNMKTKQHETKQDETKQYEKEQKPTGLKILTPKQMLQRLPIVLAHYKTIKKWILYL